MNPNFFQLAIISTSFGVFPPDGHFFIIPPEVDLVHNTLFGGDFLKSDTEIKTSFGRWAGNLVSF